jgi:hypothetical protein
MEKSRKSKLVAQGYLRPRILFVSSLEQPTRTVHTGGFHAQPALGKLSLELRCSIHSPSCEWETKLARFNQVGWAKVVRKTYMSTGDLGIGISRNSTDPLRSHRTTWMRKSKIGSRTMPWRLGRRNFLAKWIIELSRQADAWLDVSKGNTLGRINDEKANDNKKVGDDNNANDNKSLLNLRNSNTTLNFLQVLSPAWYAPRQQLSFINPASNPNMASRSMRAVEC